MNITAYKVALSLTALAVLVNRGAGDWRHYGVQLYLMLLVLVVAMVVL